MTRSRAVYAVGLVVLAALPFLARRSLPADTTCRLDHAALPAGRVVDVVFGPTEHARFCGVRCALRWLEAQHRAPSSVFVTDEATGVPVDAAAATFVESVVPSVEERDDHVHAFARRDDAVRHAAAYAGRLLEGAERPFGRHPLAARAAP